MPLLTSQPSRLLGRRATAAVSVGWYDGNATIPVANVVEHVENPTIGQAYAGGTLADAWTISIRTNLVSVPAVAAYAIDSETGRVILGCTNTPASNGYHDGTWRNITLFATGDHTYMLVSDGATIQAYKDGVAVGSTSSSASNIGGATRWRSAYDNAASAKWNVTLRAAHVANIALNSTQIAALHTSIMALA